MIASGRNIVRFVVICAERTGSSHLVATLGGHPDIFTNGNIFDDRGKKRFYAFWPKEDLTAAIISEFVDLRRNNPYVFLERVYTADYGRHHVGFKIFQGENDDILDRLVADESVRKIILYRRNVLAIYSSALAAKKTGQYGLVDGRKAKLAPKVIFKAKKFENFHNKYIQFFDDVMTKLRISRQHYYFMNYEDINNQNVLANLVSFVGADSSKEFVTNLQYKIQIKQNSFDILSRFSNPKIVRKFLHKHDLLHWAREGELNLQKLSAGTNSPHDSPEAAVIEDPS